MFWKASSLYRQSRHPQRRRSIQVLQWKSEWPRRMTGKVREKKETSESWTWHCKLSTKEQAKATGRPEIIYAGTHRLPQVAMMQIVEGRVQGRKAMARKEAKEQRMVARCTAGYAGLAASKDTLLLCAQEAATRTFLLLVRRKVKSMEKHLTMRKNCKRC